MTGPPQKGVIILSMARSGSSWLGSLSNATRTMGDTQEWFSHQRLTQIHRKSSADQIYSEVMQSASTENGRFSFKIFPQHIVDTTLQYKTDFISRIRAEHDVKFLLLTRQDRLGQAISTLRAAQSGHWNRQIGESDENPTPRLRYNFRQLCRSYFLIGRGYEFCRNYLSAQGLPYEEFVYDFLLDSPAPYLTSIAEHLEVPVPPVLASPHKMQRDEETEIWRARFQKDIAEKGVHPSVYQNDKPASNALNAARVLFGNPTKPMPDGTFY